jgi:hypothetical protein
VYGRACSNAAMQPTFMFRAACRPEAPPNRAGPTSLKRHDRSPSSLAYTVVLLFSVPHELRSCFCTRPRTFHSGPRSRQRRHGCTTHSSSSPRTDCEGEEVRQTASSLGSERPTSSRRRPYSLDQRWQWSRRYRDTEKPRSPWHWCLHNSRRECRRGTRSRRELLLGRRELGQGSRRRMHTTTTRVKPRCTRTCYQAGMIMEEVGYMHSANAPRLLQTSSPKLISPNTHSSLLLRPRSSKMCYNL